MNELKIDEDNSTKGSRVFNGIDLNLIKYSNLQPFSPLDFRSSSGQKSERKSVLPAARGKYIVKGLFV